MKYIKYLSLVGALFASSQSLVASDVPTGDISAARAIVKQGEFAHINWAITYPGIETLIDLSPDGGITPRVDVTMQARILAADVQQRTTFTSGGRQFTKFSFIWVTSYALVNDQVARLLFNGTQPSVNPEEIVWERDLNEGENITFAAGASFSGSRWYFSGRNDPNVLLLTDGDVPPEFTTWTTQSTLGTHISAYLDEEGRVDIGPRDVIVVFELTHTVTPGAGNNVGDFQDLIVLLTFESEER